MPVCLLISDARDANRVRGSRIERHSRDGYPEIRDRAGTSRDCYRRWERQAPTIRIWLNLMTLLR